MGNRAYSIPQHIQDQWMTQKHSGDEYYLNKITSQVFQFKEVHVQRDNTSVKGIIQRSLYHIPHTPKVIVLDEQSTWASALVQVSDIPLSKIASQTVLDVDLLRLIRKISMIMEDLVKLYGHFHITETMIAVTKKDDLLVWMHQSAQISRPQNPIQKTQNAESIMIRELINIIQRRRSEQNTPLMRQSFRNFAQFINYLDLQINNQISKIDQRQKTRKMTSLTKTQKISKKQSFLSKKNSILPSSTELVLRKNQSQNQKVYKTSENGSAWDARQKGCTSPKKTIERENSSQKNIFGGKMQANFNQFLRFTQKSIQNQDKQGQNQLKSPPTSCFGALVESHSQTPHFVQAIQKKNLLEAIRHKKTNTIVTNDSAISFQIKQSESSSSNQPVYYTPQYIKKYSGFPEATKKTQNQYNVQLFESFTENSPKFQQKYRENHIVQSNLRNNENYKSCQLNYGQEQRKSRHTNGKVLVKVISNQSNTVQQEFKGILFSSSASPACDSEHYNQQLRNQFSRMLGF